MIPRLGLKESLEEYAERHGVKPDRARQLWRLEGMRLLGLDPAKAVPDGFYQPRICDQACPTENGLTVLEEDDLYFMSTVQVDCNPFVDEGPL